jgi:hypothetical protein
MENADQFIRIIGGKILFDRNNLGAKFIETINNLGAEPRSMLFS